MRTLKLPLPLPRQADARTCGCGHDREAHVHLRAGSDCSGCDCPRFVAARKVPARA